jgi:hypothetical protein
MLHLMPSDLRHSTYHFVRIALFTLFLLYHIETSQCDGQQDVSITSLLATHFLPSTRNHGAWGTNILFSTYSFHMDLKFWLLACFVANPCVHRPNPSLVCSVTLQLKLWRAFTFVQTLLTCTYTWDTLKTLFSSNHNFSSPVTYEWF